MKKLGFVVLTMIATVSLIGCSNTASEEAPTPAPKVEANNKEVKPERIDQITIAGKEYEAEYYGKEDLTIFFPEFVHREFWKVNGAAEDLFELETTGNVLPIDNYPMDVEPGEIYIVKYLNSDKTVTREIHKYDEFDWEGKMCTEQIIVE